MTILDKEIEFPVAKNIEHLEKLNYEIPRYIDNQGRNKIRKGTKIKINVKDIPNGSRFLVRFKCDYCNGENQISESDYLRPYYTLINGRQFIEKDCCNNRECINRKTKEIKSNNPIPVEKSFGGKYPLLIEEWSKDNNKSPFEYGHGSFEEVLWDCFKCGSEYEMKINHRGYHNCGCPYCAGKKVNHTNCLWSTHPDIAKLLKDSQRGYEITAGYSGKEEFKCASCNFSELKFVQNIVKRGLSCPVCSDGISYPEKFVFNVLNQLKIKIERQKVFEWSKNIYCENDSLNGIKKYDFYIPHLNCIIETHGEQHYFIRDRKFERDGQIEQENDALKEDLAFKNKINHYVILNCSISSLEFIKDSIVKSDLNQLLNLKDVNWEECHSYAISSLVKLACSLWREQRSINDISKIIDVDKATVRRYLINGSEVGLCDYNGKEEGDKTRKNNLKKINEINKVRIIQLTKEGEFIREWDSVKDAQGHYKINNITAVCRGRQKTAGGYRWVYKKDYIL